VRQTKAVTGISVPKKSSTKEVETSEAMVVAGLAANCPQAGIQI